MRCLILGMTGRIGSMVASACQDRGWAHLGTWYQSPSADAVPVDVRDHDAISELVSDYQPDVTILTVQGRKNEIRRESFANQQIIRDGMKNVSRAVAEHGGLLVAFSPAAVFGDCRTAQREDAPLTPLCPMMKAHAEAESILRQTLPDRHLLIRTSHVYGPVESDAADVMSWMMRNDGESILEVADDHHVQPTYGPDLVEVVLELARMGETGTYHVVGADRQTPFTFARTAAHIFGHDCDRVTASTGTANARPWLDRAKLRSRLGARAIRNVSEGLRAIRALSQSAMFSVRQAA